ncbi:MAG TPA: RNase adapter RapZ [Aliidongia sp.]|uniref:RNase adapter RapZ n=1 Tax=Aliidongia sp. TaxID=1914230 RepID=UPI002DDCF622|nr:RNase adapter RapZ [Aliidongia sp.]HEV2678149.1 RNase adapter RapZ [Aliidongia sp.]
MALHHGTVVAFQGQGVLLRGAPGAGKSDLALRLIAIGAELVADDQVDLVAEPEGLVARAPPTIAGLIEVRGIGIRSLPHRARALVALVVDLVPSDQVERLPDPAVQRLEGCAIPSISLDPFEASTPLKLLLALGLSPTAGARPPIGYKQGAMSHPASDPGRQQDGAPTQKAARVVLVTGLSGAGRSTALKMLEDMGYEAVDNLPLSLLPRLVGVTSRREQPIAVGIDIRTRDFAVPGLLTEIDRLTDATLLFLDCDDEALARRYTETRRRHPLAGDRPVMDGIRLERGRVSPLRARADVVVDTSVLKPQELKRLLTGHFGLDNRTSLGIFVTSFSFRQGLPREADLVFDVRFLDNPYYDPVLRHLTGLDAPVQAHIAKDPVFADFFDNLIRLIAPLLPRYDREGKAYLTVAVGCTGGRHRSVYVAERIGAWLADHGQTVAVAHRDISRPVNHLVEVSMDDKPAPLPAAP